MRRITTTVVLALALTTPAWPDVVELKTGQHIEGTLKQATGTSVVIEIGGQAITFPAEKVKAIYYGTAAETKAAVSTADPALEAITALKNVESVLKAGVSYRDYSARVLGAKIVTDRMPSKNPEAKKAVDLATEFYVIASVAWNASLARPGAPSWEAQYAQAGGNPVVKECPAMWAQIQNSEANRATMSRPANAPSPAPEPVRYGLTISFKKDLLWSCASDKIAEAERFLKQ
jgi:hypothetical protein